MTHKHSLIFAVILSILPGCNKKPNAEAVCYKLHASILQMELESITNSNLEIFDALEKNTPEGREQAMLMLSIMIEHYPDVMAVLEKPPYNHKVKTTTSAEVETFLRDKKVLIQNIRDSLKSRAELENSAPGIQRRLNTTPTLPKGS